jgi:hypothetical protein
VAAETPWPDSATAFLFTANQSRRDSHHMLIDGTGRETLGTTLITVFPSHHEIRWMGMKKDMKRTPT